jgi:hypothetical protein
MSLKATTFGGCTLVGFMAKSYPMSRGNCFDVGASNNKSYRILNFGYENLKELCRRGTVEWPIEIEALTDRHAIIKDSRIPSDWYQEKYCLVCTPKELRD